MREELTSGGAVITVTVSAEQVVNGAIWRVVRKRNAGVTIASYIELTVGQKVWVEGGGLRRVDCPLGFLGMVPTVDRDWRDRVWSYHESLLNK